MKLGFLRGLLAVVSFALLVPAAGFAASLASDKASNPAYSGGWTNGSNGGVGWGANPWLLFVAGVQTSTPTAQFISSSTTNNSSGDTNGDGDINTAGVAWGLLGNGQEVDAARFLNGGALVNGQRFVIEMDNGTIVPAGQELGFLLQTSDGETRLEFLLKTNSVTYELQGGINTGITNTDQGLRFVFQQVNTETGHVFITKLVDGSSFVFSNVALNQAVVTHDVAAFSLINKSAGGASTNKLFFNSISILPNPADTTLFADLGVTKTVSPNPAIVGSNFTYTITVTNSGPAQATAVTLTDTPPVGIAFVATPSQGTYSTNLSGQVIYDLGVLASNATASITLVGAPGSTGALTNIASVAALNVDPNPANNVVTNTVNVVTAVTLSVSPASHDFGLIATGTTVQTSFAVTNGGGATMTGTVSVAGLPFAVASGSPLNVPGFGTTNVVINFTPTIVGAFTDNVIFVSNGGNSTNQVTGSAAITPAANFTGAPTVGAASLLVTFTNTSTGTITNQLWTFGDGGNSGSVNPSHSYTNAGTFSVSLNVLGPLGSSNLTRSSYITVTNVVPVLTVTPSSRSFGTQLVGTISTQNFSVINSGLSTLSGTATVSGTSFALLSGSPFNLTAAQTGTVAVTFLPASAAAFTGSVVFASNGGASSNVVTGTGANLPVPGFTGAPTTGSVSLAVTFTNTSTGTITNQLWNFGDTGTSTSVSPSHSYTNAGTFSVSLTVFGPLGSSNLTRSSYIVATNVNPTAGFTASPTNGAAPLTVNFTDASSGSVTSRVWSFGDGDFSTSVNPTHVYTNAGPVSFTVSLTVRGLTGSNTLTRSALITVTGSGKSSAVGDWEVTVSGADKGIAFLTFSNNATASGYEIRLKKFGLDTISGTWSNDAKGKLTGPFIERLGGATNWTGALIGKAKTLKNIITKVVTTNGVYRWKGVPATDLTDLSGTWSGQVTVARIPTNVEYAVTSNVTNGVFNVATTAATNTVIGQFIITSKDAIAGYITITTNQATLEGKFKVKLKESRTVTNQLISLQGKTLDDGDKVKLDLIKE